MIHYSCRFLILINRLVLRSSLGLLLIASALAGCNARVKDSSAQPEHDLEPLNGRIWYDAEKSAYRPPKVSTEFDDAIRTSGWEAKAKAPTPNTPAPPPGRWAGWSNMFDGLSVFVWLILGVVLIALAALLASTSMKFGSRDKKRSKTAKAVEIDPARVVDLPFEAEVEMNDPMEAARRMANAGNYDAAVQYLYGYMLLALDRAGKITLHRGKTNRMYLFEIGSDRELRDLLSPVMLAFEDVFFGRHTIDRARFQQLWQSLGQFNKLLAHAVAGREAAQEATAL